MADKRITEFTATNTVENDDWLPIDSPTAGTRKIKPKDVADVEKANQNFAEKYNEAVSYTAGDLVMHDDKLYECSAATTGTWDSTKWNQTTVDNLFGNISSSADHITYDNTSSGLTSDDVQEAIDEVYTKVGSATLTTTATNLSGAVNELDLEKSEVVTLPNKAAWDALPASKLTDNKLYKIPGASPAETDLWDKVGTDPLDTTAQDLSGGINELKSSLTNYSVYEKYDTVTLSSSKATKWLNTGDYLNFYQDYIILGVDAYSTNSADNPVIVGVQVSNNAYILRFLTTVSSQASARVTFRISYIKRPS